MKIQLKIKNGKASFFCGRDLLAYIDASEEETDSFQEIEPGIWRWTRRTDKPVRHMEMRMEVNYAPSYWMIPAVNYNGNQFGEKGDSFSFFQGDEEYSGMTFEGKPWTYGFDRCSVPAAVYSEGNGYSAALFADRMERCSCSIRQKDNKESGNLNTDQKHITHALHWPLIEGPKVLWREWRDQYAEEMEAKQEFHAYIILQNTNNDKFCYNKMLDFAWKNMAAAPKCQWDKEALWNMKISYAKTLFERNEDGFCGFNIGMGWNQQKKEWSKQKQHKYEIGWCGQNASLANSMLLHYLRHGDREALEIGIQVLDSWSKYAWVTPEAEAGPRIFRTHMDNTKGGTEKDLVSDACNLGTAAIQFFQAAHLAETIGIQKPAWKETAIEICEFVLLKQEKNGKLAKSWDFNGNVAQSEGTVGCFLVPALLKATEVTGNQKYLIAAEKAYLYYRKELMQNGCTTAGALDTFCVDKESAIPLLKSGIRLYELMKKEEYLDDAIRAAWYLSTWQWHYNIDFPSGTLLALLSYQSCGATAVSTAHHHLDAFALCYCRDLDRLYEITGNIQWKERSEAILNNATQFISDGTLEILGKKRPLGSQDEGVTHTRWGNEYALSEWLVAWPGAFHLENMW